MSGFEMFKAFSLLHNWPVDSLSSICFYLIDKIYNFLSDLTPGINFADLTAKTQHDHIVFGENK
jgi:hypothetical protein